MTGGPADGGDDDGADLGVEVADAGRAGEAKMAGVFSLSERPSISLSLSLSLSLSCRASEASMMRCLRARGLLGRD